MKSLIQQIREYFYPSDEALFFRRAMGISLIFHIAAAYFSVGYHAADEQFQILEFLAYKLGFAPAYDLPVEFHEKMRPWVQPGIYYLITRFWQAIGITSPHFWAASFRLFTGLIGWTSTVVLASCCKYWFGNQATRRLAILCLAWIWYFPIFHVRPSSESLGGSAFALGLALVTLGLQGVHQKWKKVPPNTLWILAGAAFGLSFEARFQMALMIVGLGFWLIVRARKWQTFAFLTLGFSAVFVLGRWADHWGYGSWSFSPWNYFSYNLIRGEVSKFGHAPWWDFLRMSQTETWPILGFLMASACVIAWIRHPFHILTWSHVPFFIVHELIAHKELRFFFPIASMGPVLLVLALCSAKTRTLPSWPKNIWLKRTFKGALVFLVLNNAIALIALTTIPLARTVQFQEAVFKNAPASDVPFHLYTDDRNPFQILGNPIYFYRVPGLHVHRFQNYEELKQNPYHPVWLFDAHFELPEEARKILPHCERVFRTLPSQIQYLNFGNWISRANVWSLYRCD